MPNYLRIKVTPKSAKSELKETMADGTLKIRIAAPPEKGKANEELIKFLANHFNVPKTAITIVSGKSDPLKKIVDAADIKPHETIVEIGPGRGILTQELATRAKKVIALELDQRLIPELLMQFPPYRNVAILHQDALTFIPPDEPYKLVANIPYYITSPILNHFLREQPESQRPTSLTLLVQKEVAEKIIASHGKNGETCHSVLSLQVHLFGKPKIIATVPASHFTPAPKVDSAILHIERNAPLLPDANLPDFFKLLHTGFCHPRKKLIRNLCGLGWLSLNDLQKIFAKFKLDENLRAEDVTLEAWKKLYGETRPSKR